MWVDSAQLVSSERVLFAELMASDAIAFEPDVEEYARCVTRGDEGVLESIVVRMSAAGRPRLAPAGAEELEVGTWRWSTAAPRGAALGEDVRRFALRGLGARRRPFMVLASSPTGTSLVVRTTSVRDVRGIRVTTSHAGGLPDLPEEDVPFAVEMLLTMNARATQSFGARLQEQGLGEGTRLSWSMLQVEANDGALQRAARRETRSRLPLEAFDPLRLDLIRAEALRQCAAVRHTEGAEHHTRASDCARFHAYLYLREERPVDARQAVAAYRDAGMIEAARALAERAYHDAPSDPSMRALWLESAAPEELTRVFAQLHPELAPHHRQRWVTAAPGYLAEGLSGVLVESSFLASLLTPQPAHARADVALPPEALADLAYVLLLAEGAAGPFSVRVSGALHPDAPSVTLGVGARWNAEGAVWAAQVDEPNLARVRALSLALRAQLATSGEARLVVAMGSAQLTWVLGLDAGRVQLARDSSRREWSTLSREVALPLAQLPTTRFPLPSLSLQLSEETMTLLSPALGRASGIVCNTTPTTLQCTAREAGPDALLQVLVALVQAR